MGRYYIGTVLLQFLFHTASHLLRLIKLLSLFAILPDTPADVPGASGRFPLWIIQPATITPMWHNEDYYARIDAISGVSDRPRTLPGRGIPSRIPCLS